MRHEVEAKNGKLVVRCIVSILAPVVIDGEVRSVGDLIDMDDTEADELIASGRADVARNEELQHALHVGVAWHSVRSQSRPRAQRTKAMQRLSKRVRSLDDVTLQDVRHAASV